MSSLVNRLLRPVLKSLTPYQSARRLMSLASSGESNVDWLNANESPFEPELDVDLNILNRYPDAQPEPLIKAYAEYANLSQEQVLATRGADEGIELLIRSFCRGDGRDSIIICPPTYGMYGISAKTQGAISTTVPLLPNWQLDVPELLPKLNSCKLIFLCSPNNPTGNGLNKADLRTVLESARGRCLVVIDEAYIEFCPESTLVSWLEEFNNLVILRTLSKAFGLASLRCGFVLASKDILAALQLVIAPYPIAGPVAQLATQALGSESIAKMQACVAKLNALKGELSQALGALAFIQDVYPSDANFILVKFRQGVCVSTLLAYLKENQILVRDLSHQAALTNTLRISIGDQVQNQKVITLIKKWEQSR